MPKLGDTDMYFDTVLRLNVSIKLRIDKGPPENDSLSHDNASSTPDTPYLIGWCKCH
jgi:hypothetical protein